MRHVILILFVSVNLFGQGAPGPSAGGFSLPFTVSITPSVVTVTNGTLAKFGFNDEPTLEPPGITTITPLSGTASEIFKIGIGSNGNLKVFTPSNGLTCVTSGFPACDVSVGSTFPDATIPLADVTTMTNGTGSFRFVSMNDWRFVLQSNPLTAGFGMIYTKSGAQRILSVDSSIVPIRIASGTVDLATAAIGSGTCASAITISAPSVLTTDNLLADFNSDPTSVVGYTPSSSGMLTIIKYPALDNLVFKVCNNTNGSITPGTVTLNWRVMR